jgi:hypothetical protein
MRQVKRQHVNFVIILEGAELNTGDYPYSQPLSGFSRSCNAADRIVVGKRECLQAATRRGFDYLRWWKGPVGGGRVSVKVDERRPTRLTAHRV